MSFRFLKDDTTFLLGGSEAIVWENIEPFVPMIWSPLDLNGMQSASINTTPIISSLNTSEPTNMIPQFCEAGLDPSVQSSPDDRKINACYRTNPKTGRPCNVTFKRSHDLTRHEGTVHNLKKFTCRICNKEKFFSHMDGLAKHLRTVHPELEFPELLQHQELLSGTTPCHQNYFEVTTAAMSYQSSTHGPTATSLLPIWQPIQPLFHTATYPNYTSDESALVPLVTDAINPPTSHVSEAAIKEDEYSVATKDDWEKAFRICEQPQAPGPVTYVCLW
jgi:hypothetical protein